jgi:hypothetical protein
VTMLAIGTATKVRMSAICAETVAAIASVNAIVATAPAIFVSASGIFATDSACAGLKSACFPAEVGHGIGVGTFPGPFRSPGGAAFDAMAG